MKTAYFTFGQTHKHVFDTITFDQDIVVKIIADEPRTVMKQLFGHKWGLEYEDVPELKFFPRGIYELKPPYPMRKAPSTREYLGDSVYAESDGYGIVLTTENGGYPSNRIVLAPEVYAALVDYVVRLYE